MATSNIKSWDELMNGQLGDAIEKALTNAAAMVEATAKNYCPVDDGQLRNSIKYNVDCLFGQYIAEVGTNVSYAVYVHEGTGVKARKGNGRKTPWTYQGYDGTWWHHVTGQEPQPFLEEAVNSCRTGIIKSFEGII